MEQWDYFFFLVTQMGSGLFIVTPLVVLFFIASFNDYSRAGMRFDRSSLFALLPFIFPPIMIYLGVYFEEGGLHPIQANGWLWLLIISTTIVIQVAVNMACILRLRRLQFSLSVLALIQAVITFAAILVSGMSISGVWI